MAVITTLMASPIFERLVGTGTYKAESVWMAGAAGPFFYPLPEWIFAWAVRCAIVA
jgi:hypothetical protein